MFEVKNSNESQRLVDMVYNIGVTSQYIETICNLFRVNNLHLAM